MRSSFLNKSLHITNCARFNREARKGFRKGHKALVVCQFFLCALRAFLAPFVVNFLSVVLAEHQPIFQTSEGNKPGNYFPNVKVIFNPGIRELIEVCAIIEGWFITPGSTRMVRLLSTLKLWINFAWM